MEEIEHPYLDIYRNLRILYNVGDLPYIPVPFKKIEAYTKLPDFKQNRIKRINTIGVLMPITRDSMMMLHSTRENVKKKIKLDIENLFHDTIFHGPGLDPNEFHRRAVRVFGLLEQRGKEIVIRVDHFSSIDNIERCEKTLKLMGLVARQKISVYRYDVLTMERLQRELAKKKEEMRKQNEMAALLWPGDEEWDEHEPPEDFEDGSNLGIIKREDEDEDEDDEEEELQRAFSHHSEDYLQNGGPSSVQDPDLENHNSLDSDALGTGSSSWHSEDGGTNSRRGGETPSSCATPTSASFPSEPEVDAEIGVNADGNNPAAPYPCQFCDRTFPRLSYLKKHEQSHGDQMPYRCNWCARLFKHKRSRDRHVKLHTGDRRYRCSHCEAAFSRSDHLKIHMKTHDNQKPYQCTACSRGYNTAAALTSHMQSHKKHQNSGQNSKLEMDYGRRSVSSHSTSSPPIGNSPSPSLNLTLHQKTSLKSNYINSNGASNAPLVNSPLKLACMYCTRDSFTSMQQLQMHVHAMHQAILNGESLTIASPTRSQLEVKSYGKSQDHDKPEKAIRKDYEMAYRLEDPEKSAERSKGDLTESEFSCGQCTMKFSNVSSLRDHLLSIHRNDGFTSNLMMCPLCGIPCTSAAAYAEHYLLRHCENRRLPSKDLNRRDWEENTTNGIHEENQVSTKTQSFIGRNEVASSEPADLTKKHTRPGDSSYTAGTLLCGQCGAALKDFESFREHLARHLQADQQNIELTPRNPCPKCDANFSEREEMLAHLTKHYLGQMTKEYACGACKKFYPHPDLLQRHLLDTHAHHLYRCALCRDTFDSRVAIQVHFAVKHSQECRIYRCITCTASNNENSPGNSSGEGRSYFRSENEMANHVRNVHAPPNSIANEGPSPKSRASTPGPNIPSSRCVFCGICCNSDLELQLHLASHSSSLYRCPICREGFPVEFLLDRHIAQAHHTNSDRNEAGENGRTHRTSRLGEETTRPQKRGRSPASSNNNSLNQRDNNNKRLNYGSTNGATMVRNGQRCDLCEHSEFATEAELQAHKKLVHTPVKLQAKSLSSLSMTCAYCGEICRSRSELESHTRMQHASNEPGGRHKCNICDEVCPSGGILAEHKLQKHCKIQLSDNCIVCRSTLTSEAQFIEHVQRHSLENSDPQQRLDNALPHLPAGCVVCRQTLISDLECRLHARHHLRASSSLQNLNSSPTPINHKNQQQQQQQPQQQQQLQRPMLSCCLCLREFTADDFVSLPSNPSSTPAPSLRLCKTCYVRHSQGLPILNSPYEHVRPSKSETLMWPAAAKDQSNWEGSRDHWDNERCYKTDDSGIGKIAIEENTDEKRCEECGIKFESSEEAESHRIKEHENNCASANIYTCIQCQMSFPTEDKIQQHVRKEHLESPNQASIEALRCHLCLFEANSPLQLQGHLIEHTFAGCAGLTCYICQALFTTPIALQNHMLQQHGLGARPYDCSNCNLKFFFRIELDHHTVMVHRRTETSSPRVDVGQENTTEKRENITDNRATDDNQHRLENITVKEEIANSPEDEDINVDGNIDQTIDHETKHESCTLVDAKKEPFTVPRAMDEKTVS